jgi:AraC-like DNA-binding protein
VITAGQFSCLVDFHIWSLKAPAVALLLPGQVVESIEVDEYFAGFGMMMNQEFTDSLNLPVSLQERLFIKDTQFYTVPKEATDVLTSLYKQVSSVINQRDNPYKDEIIRHLFSAHYYGLGYYMHGLLSQPSAMTSQQEKCEKFMSFVSENFKAKRDVGFYADKLCMSSKYLSTLLKQETGMTALDWIERHVVLYAKSCLSSTSMTIQEISDELKFPSQSVFGKYFKRVEGLSPKAYRHSLSKE